MDAGKNLTDEDWLPNKIYLVDRTPPLVQAWREAFASIPEIQPLEGDYFQQPADAIVSPANSFGIMDGGLDLALRDVLGYGVQSKLTQLIIDKYHGELPIGCAEIIETGHADWKYLISAPTMRVPEPVSATLNAYVAFRAILLAIETFNKQTPERPIRSLVCSGLCTGIGKMSPATCAGQMQLAYKSMLLPAKIGRFDSIHQFHQALRKL